MIPPELWTSREPLQNGWYRFVRRFISGNDVVVDYGSGTGVGAEILRAACDNVIEVDSDERLWKHGAKSPDILYAIEPDWIICIDMIEHVTAREQEELVSLFKKRARLGTFISTPNRDEWPGNMNPYHIRELSPEDLEALIDAPFEKYSAMVSEDEKEVMDGWITGARHLAAMIRASDLKERSAPPSPA